MHASWHARIRVNSSEGQDTKQKLKRGMKHLLLQKEDPFNPMIKLCLYIVYALDVNIQIMKEGSDTQWISKMK